MVCSSAAACSSVRADKSVLPAAIWPVAVAMASLPERTCTTVRPKLSFMSRSACSNSLVSSLPVTSMRLLKSPLATVRASTTARRSGSVMERVMPNDKTRPTTRPTAPSASISVRALRILLTTVWPSSSTSFFCSAVSALIGSCSASSAGRVWDCSSAVALSRSPASTKAATRPNDCTYLPRNSLRRASAALPSGSWTFCCSRAKASSMLFLLTAILALIACSRCKSVVMTSSIVKRALARVVASMRLAASDLTQLSSMMRSLTTPTSPKRSTPTALAPSIISTSRPKASPRRVPIVKKLSCMEKFLNEDSTCYFILGWRPARCL